MFKLICHDVSHVISVMLLCKNQFNFQIMVVKLAYKYEQLNEKAQSLIIVV